MSLLPSFRFFILLLICIIAVCRAKNVVIVGAGTAGIATARYLLDYTDFDVTILEAGDRYGGRMYTYYPRIAPAMPVELGGMWVHMVLQHHPVEMYFRRHNISLHENAAPAKAFFGNSTDVYEHLDPQEQQILFSESLEKLYKLSRDYWVHTDWPDVSILDAARQNSEYRRWYDSLSIYVKAFVELFIEADFGDRKELISARFFDGMPITDPLYKDTDDGDLTVPSGYRTFLDSLIRVSEVKTKPLREVEIQLNRRVTEITVLQPSEQVVVETSHGDFVTADYVVVTVPLGVLKAGSSENNIVFNPPLSEQHQLAIQHIGFGNFVKALLIYDRLFWPPQSSWLVYFPNEFNFTSSLIRAYFVNLYDDFGVPALLASFNGPYADLVDTMSDDELRVLTQRIIDAMFPGAQYGVNLLQFNRTNWRTNPLFFGAYSYGAVGMTPAHAYDIRKPHASRVFFAGEHTMFPEKMYGYVHGAFMSGYRAASDIMAKENLPLPPNPSSAGVLQTQLCRLSHIVIFAVLTIQL